MPNRMIGEKREGSVNLTSKDGMLLANETYMYIVEADSKDETRWTILADTPGIPEPMVTISPANIGICKSVSAERDPNNPIIWHVTAQFSSEVDEESSGRRNPVAGGGHDPTSWIPIRETYLEPYTAVADSSHPRWVCPTDWIVGRNWQNGMRTPPKSASKAKGFPYTNGMGTPLSTLPEVARDNIRWDFFQFDTVSVTDEMIANVNNVVNKYVYMGKDIHTLLLKVRKSTIGFYFGIQCRLTEFSLIWKQDTWEFVYANQGNQFMDVDGTVYPYIYEGTDEIIVGPLGQRNVQYNQPLLPRGNVQSLQLWDPADPYNQNWTPTVVNKQGDGFPTWGIVDDGPTKKAVRPPALFLGSDNSPSASGVLYTISRLNNPEADFKKFLRL
jgi:hypothetical protein